jgi:hypothetical protein
MQHASSVFSLRLTRRSVAIAGGAAMALAIFAALAVVLTRAQPAHGHDTPSNCIARYYPYGGPQRGVACTQFDHRVLDGCDRYEDGLRVRAWTYGGLGYGTGRWDPNGANSGCAHDDIPRSELHRICVEQPVGCSNWYPS